MEDTGALPPGGRHGCSALHLAWVASGLPKDLHSFPDACATQPLPSRNSDQEEEQTCREVITIKLALWCKFIEKVVKFVKFVWVLLAFVDPFLDKKLRENENVNF